MQEMKVTVSAYEIVQCCREVEKLSYSLEKTTSHHCLEKHYFGVFLVFHLSGHLESCLKVEEDSASRTLGYHTLQRKIL